MWEWSRTVTERAVAAGWSGRCRREPRPTVVDPEPWVRAQEQRDERSGDHREDGMPTEAAAIDAYCLAG